MSQGQWGNGGGQGPWGPPNQQPAHPQQQGWPQQQPQQQGWPQQQQQQWPPQQQGYPQQQQGWQQQGGQYAQNPYAPPVHPGYGPPGAGVRNASGKLMACPQCGSPNVTKPSYTWWGGILGPMVFNHHVCGSCGLGFNGKSGKSNKPAITIYLCVSFGLVILVILARAF